MTDRTETTEAAAATATKPKVGRKAPATPKKAPRAGRGAKADKGTGKGDKAATKPRSPKQPKPRTGTKQAELIAMLRRPDGATVPEMVKALGWQAHTARGAIAGALKKKLGLKVNTEKVDGRGRVYRIAD